MMLVILRMNREFMDFMHIEYPELMTSFANGHFSFTTVEPVWSPQRIRLQWRSELSEGAQTAKEGPHGQRAIGYVACVHEQCS